MLPLYAERLGASGVWLGFIFSAFSLARFIVMPIAGALSDRCGRKILIANGLFFYALISLGFLFAHTSLTLTLLRLGQGLCAAMIIPIAQAYAGDIAPQSSEGKVMGLFSMALFAGMGVGPLLGGFLQDLYGMHAGIWTLSFLTFAAFLIVVVLLVEGPSIKSSARVSGSYGELLRHRLIAGLTFLRFTAALCRGAIIVFVPLFAHKVLHLNASQIGIVISVNILLTAALQLPAGILADRCSRKILITGSGLVFAVLIFAIPSIRGFIELFVFSTVSGISGAVMLAAATAVMAEQGRRFGMGKTMSLFNMSMSLGLAVGPLLAGWLVDLTGLAPTFYFLGLVAFAGIVAFTAFGVSYRSTAGAENEPSKSRSPSNLNLQR